MVGLIWSHLNGASRDTFKQSTNTVHFISVTFVVIFRLVHYKVMPSFVSMPARVAETTTTMFLNNTNDSSCGKTSSKKECAPKWLQRKNTKKQNTPEMKIPITSACTKNSYHSTCIKEVSDEYETNEIPNKLFSLKFSIQLAFLSYPFGTAFKFQHKKFAFLRSWNDAENFPILLLLIWWKMRTFFLFRIFSSSNWER